MRPVFLFGAVVFAVATKAIAAAPAVIVATGKGAQIYTCAQTAAGLAWRLKAPDAVLTDLAGHFVAHHFAGPSWQAADGGTVVGKVMVEDRSPDPHAIAWLVLGVKTAPSTGLFAGVSYIVRSATSGGVAPVSGCDAPHAGAETRVDYYATYTFFSER